MKVKRDVLAVAMMIWSGSVHPFPYDTTYRFDHSLLKFRDNGKGGV